MMSRAVALAALVLVWLAQPAPGRAEGESTVVENLNPIHDTYACHDDKTVHGFETILRVGIEPQECVPGGFNPCSKEEECCTAEPYNYCAPKGQCAATTPAWTSFRPYRGYIRFNMNLLPKGKVLSATLRLTQVAKVQEMGGPFNIQITALKGIGLGEDQVCEWSEQTLNDTNGTTWNSLPQNVSVTEDGIWAWDVTKAVTDWVNGNSDIAGTPTVPNCGFHIYDDAYGKEEAPIQRWVDFSSKEGEFNPQLKVQLALDLDGDGYFDDCDETDPAIHEGAAEICDGKDQDCDDQVDEEDCDGLDNDCDGEIDEGDYLCGDGQTCACSQCVVTCEDECGGPYSLKCEFNDQGLWERWACKADADYDPCLDWYKVEDCKAGDFCEYGSCSGNCVDDCDLQGEQGCTKATTWTWYIGLCDDWDADGCLEWGDLQPCGNGAYCYDSKCWPTIEQQCQTLKDGGCVNQCVPNTLKCEFLDDGFNHIMECLQDLDGCWKWTSKTTCNDASKLLCKEKSLTSVMCTSDADCWSTCADSLQGQLHCFRDNIGRHGVYECNDIDKDGCLEWELKETCEVGAGCVEGECTLGCSAQCGTFGEAICDSSKAVCCFDRGRDGLLEWNLVMACDAQTQECKDGLCIPLVPDCEDECPAQGASVCETDGEGLSFMYTCIPDFDEDPCLEWGNQAACPFGCNEALTECGQAPPDEIQTVEPVSDVTAQAEPAEVIWGDVYDCSGPHYDLPAVPDAMAEAVPQADGKGDVAGGEKEDDDGCTAARGSSAPLIPALLLLAGMLFLLARRRKLD
jgi:hypothetical protein